MFIAIGTQLLNVAESLPTDPPTSNTTTSPVISAWTFVVGTTPAATLTLDGSGSADDFILVAFCLPLSAGRSFVPAWWQNQVVAGDATTISDVLADYEAEFGAPVAGQRVFVKLTPVNQYGVTGTPVSQFATVTAS
jgi:hypothetical protein